jgi:hypothetical protein
MPLRDPGSGVTVTQKNETKPSTEPVRAAEPFAWLTPEQRKIVLESYSVRVHFRNTTPEWQDAFLKGLTDLDGWLAESLEIDRVTQAIVDGLNQHVIEEHARDVAMYTEMKARGETPSRWLAHQVENDVSPSAPIEDSSKVSPFLSRDIAAQIAAALSRDILARKYND